MHLYYGKYLEKLKNEIDRLIILEVESDGFNADVEHYIETLFENYESAKKCLRKEMAEGSESDIPASRA